MASTTINENDLCKRSNTYYLNSFDYTNWYNNLVDEYRIAQNYFIGPLRDRVLAQLIVEYSDTPYPEFDLAYQQFKNDSINPTVKENTIRRVDETRAKLKRKKNEWNTVLSSAKIKSIEGKELVLSDVIKNKKFIIIDCWATWCQPCMKQKPYLEEFEEKYKDSISFVYLSADEDYSKWENYIKATKPHADNQFFLVNSFKSAFATFFNIDAIPRYIFLKNEGKDIVSSAMPIPAVKDAFNMVLKEAINL